ncbi:MAG: glycosyltransferase [Bacteroidales bacterium]|nr:glycosyltransferase [Bacteroidales bacterium]
MNKAKKVIIVGSAYPLRGGIATFNERMSRAFSERGYISILYNYTLQYPGFLFPGRTQYTKEPPPQTLLIKNRVNSVWPLNWIRVGREIRRENPDYVILRYWMPFFGPCLGTIARIVKKNKRIRIIALVDNIIPHESTILDKLFIRYFLRPVNRFVTLSATVLSELNSFGRQEHALFTPHPLYDNFGSTIPRDEACAQLAIDSSGVNLLFFGFIRAYKGLDILLYALHEVLQSHPDVKLMIVGEFYDDREKYIELIDRLHLNPHIYLFDRYVDSSEVNQYFCAADLIVQPYKTASQSGVSQIAYHFNKPMVVTNVGALPDMVPDGKAGYVTEVNANAVARAITDFIAHPDRDSFTRHIRMEKKKYSWDLFIDKLIALAEA